MVFENTINKNKLDEFEKFIIFLKKIYIELSLGILISFMIPGGRYYSMLNISDLMILISLLLISIMC